MAFLLFGGAYEKIKKLLLKPEKMAVLDTYHLRRSFSRKRIGTRCTLTIEYTLIRCNVYVRGKNDHRHRQSHAQNEQIKKEAVN